MNYGSSPADGRDPIPSPAPSSRMSNGYASVVMPELAKGVPAKAFGVTIEDGGRQPDTHRADPAPGSAKLSNQRINDKSEPLAKGVARFVYALKTNSARYCTFVRTITPRLCKGTWVCTALVSVRNTVRSVESGAVIYTLPVGLPVVDAMKPG